MLNMTTKAELEKNMTISQKKFDRKMRPSKAVIEGLQLTFSKEEDDDEEPQKPKKKTKKTQKIAKNEEKKTKKDEKTDKKENFHW